MRPDGIGRSGSLMASTWRSNQSCPPGRFAPPGGPASSTPAITVGQRCPTLAPDEMMPQPKAHIGGNQVIGLSSSRTTSGEGRASVGIGAISVMLDYPTL